MAEKEEEGAAVTSTRESDSSRSRSAVAQRLRRGVHGGGASGSPSELRGGEEEEAGRHWRGRAAWQCGGGVGVVAAAR